MNKYREVRKFLCTGGFIEGVILLPDKMYSNTWINPYMLVMGRNNKVVKFLDDNLLMGQIIRVSHRLLVFNKRVLFVYLNG